MNAPISGGAPANPLVRPVTESDMQQIKLLEATGFAQGDPRAPVPDSAYKAIVGLRSARGMTPGQRYKAWMQNRLDLRNSADPRVQKQWAEANRPFVQAALLGSGTVHTNATMSNLSIMYGNDEYIGLELAPVVPVAKKSDVFYTYNKRDRLASPAEDEVGDYGDAVEIEEGRGTDSYLCVPRATKKKIAASTIANQDAPLDEMMDTAEAVAEARALRREIRTVDVLTTAANFATTNKETLSGTGQWNHASGGDPIGKFQAADQALWTGRGTGTTIMASSLAIYHVLAKHPDIVGLYIYNGSTPGLATPDMIARLMGWDRYLVSRARRDTAVEGDAASYARIWGDFLGVYRVMQRPSVRNVAFAVTMRWTAQGMPGSNGGIVSKQWYRPEEGFGGCYYVEQGEAEQVKVLSDDTAFLYSDCLA